MGDPPGDIGPGRRPLSRDQIGDVVEGDDIAEDLLACGFGGDPDQKVPLAPARSILIWPSATRSGRLRTLLEQLRPFPVRRR